MELQDYVRVIRKRWRVIMATIVLALAAAAGYTLLTPPVYQSTAQLFVSTSSAASPADLAAGKTFTQSQVKTYADLVTTPRVLDPVIARLSLPRTATELGRVVDATVPAETVLINISARSGDAQQAPAIANAVAEQTAKTIPELETVSRTSGSPVKVSVVMSAGPAERIAPRPLRTALLGLALGCVLGLGLGLLRDRYDTTLKSENDVKEITDSTVIGSIPYDATANSSPLIIQSGPHAIRAEAFRVVRTNLQFVDVTNHPRVFAVTSSVPGEGKTTTAANLAFTMAAQGARVCVAEGDLRRAKLSEYLGMESGVGLTSVLIGEADLDDVLQPLGESGVVLLGAGPVPPNPSELLGSPAMQELVAQLRRRFDYVVIDTPPLLPVTDAAVVSKLVDGAVLVVGASVVRREHVLRSLEILGTVGARTLGLIVNRAPTGGRDAYSYAYGYSHSHEPAAPRNKRAGHRVLTATGARRSGARRGTTPRRRRAARLMPG